MEVDPLLVHVEAALVLLRGDAGPVEKQHRRFLCGLVNWSVSSRPELKPVWTNRRVDRDMIRVSIFHHSL